MRWTHALRARLRLLFRRAAEERMSEEIRFHLEMEAQKYLRAGLTPEEARRRAALAFGGVEGHKEAMREGRTLGWLSGASLDLKLALRMMAKHRGLTLIGGFAMAVAIAIGATAFEGISEALNPVLPLDGGERVVAVQYATDNPGNPERRIAHDFVEWREELVSIEQLAAFRKSDEMLVTPDGAADAVNVAEITASGFRVARTPPLMGRYLVPEDEIAGAEPVVVIGYEEWLSRFGGDPDVVGRTLRFGSGPRTVVGVMPEGFGFPLNHQFWTPLHLDPAAHERMRGPRIYVFGRLAPGFTTAGAQAELETFGRRLAAEHPEAYERLRPRVLAYTHEHLELDHPVIRLALRFLQLLVGGLLVVVAVNLAILFYARTISRLGEIAVRTALGASRRRILGQLFLEAFALAVVGATGGLLLSHAVMGWAREQFAMVDDIPFWIDMELSAGTVLYALALAVVAAGIMGVVPGVKATGSRLGTSLRAVSGRAGPGLGRVWTSLIVAQVAIAVACLPMAVFTVWQGVKMELAEIGFPAEELVVGTLLLRGDSEEGYGEEADPAAARALARARQLELVRRMEAEPGVTAVTLASGVPGLDGIGRRFELEGEAAASSSEPTAAGTLLVGEGMFEAFDAEILAGRDFQPGDRGDAARTVVVNRAFVRDFLGDRPALGQRLRYTFGRQGPGGEQGPGPWYEIVGVVEDFPAVSLSILASSDVVPNIYHAVEPGELDYAALFVRFRGGVPPGLVGRVQEVAFGVDPELRLSARPLAELYGSLRAASRFVAWGLALVTSAVLLLSAAGIYALMSFTVAQRTREIGIRSALGAHPRRILGSILGRVVRQLGFGVLVGSLLSGGLFAVLDLAMDRAAALMLAVAVIMLVVGVLAAFGPARRGLRVQPMEALREA